MVILGLNTGHDASAALLHDGELIAYCKEERLTRKKQDAGRPLRQRCIDEVLRIAGLAADELDAVCLDRGRYPADCFRNMDRPWLVWSKHLLGRSHRLLGQMRRQRQLDELMLLDAGCIRRYLGLSGDAEVLFANHHYAHVLGAFRYTTWEADALYVAVDAGGDGVCHAAYGFNGRQLVCLYGGDEFILGQSFDYAGSVGQAYSYVTQALGFRANRHEGKITGLAGFGRPVLGEEIRTAFEVKDDGSIRSGIASRSALHALLTSAVTRLPREDVAASIQYATEEVTLAWIEALRKRFPARYLGLSGGVFSNVRLNQRVAELPGIEEVFVFPAMGDEGLSVGQALAAQVRTAGLGSVRRGRLAHVYLGAQHSGTALLAAAHQRGLIVTAKAAPARTCAELLADGNVGAIYSQRMEMGPRALGARSILASPAERAINDQLNQRLDRTEFMPFAPYVLDEDAHRVFEINRSNKEACRFMTMTTDVHPSYRDRIPAVVHVDGTARPQIIERGTNPLYYDILSEYKALSGLPCLINTSFNAHEEPIINTPDEALTALQEQRVDFLITEGGFVSRTTLGRM